MLILQDNIRLEEALEKASFTFLDNTALCEWTGKKWKEITYHTLLKKAQAFSHQLNQHGIQPGERVILSSKNRTGLVVALFGTWLSKATAVLIDPDLPNSTWSELCFKSDSRIMLVENDRLISAKNIETCKWVVEISDEKYVWHETNETLSETVFNDCDSEIATLIFTSGTSGEYKGVVLKHQQFVHMAGLYCDFLPKDSTTITVLPIFHVAGLFCGILQPLLLGARIVFFRLFSADALENAFTQYKPIVIFAVPKLLEILRKKIKLSLSKKNIFVRCVFYSLLGVSGLLDKYFNIKIGQKCFRFIYNQFGGKLNKILCGSAALPPSVQAFFLSLGFDVTCAYGLSETCGPISIVSTKNRWHIGSVGRALEKDSLYIASSGEIVYRGKAMMSGYFRDQIATNKIIKNSCLHTGDLGKLDKNGNLYIIGRIKELIIFQDGKKATPEQIEKEYQYIPGIKSCAAFGVVENYKVIAVLAFIPDYKEKTNEIIANIFKVASRLKTPYRISDVLLVEKIPQSSIFKIKRNELASLYFSEKENNVSIETRKMEDKFLLLLSCFKEAFLDSEIKITLDTTFAELQIDSLEAAQLAQIIGKKLNMDVNPTVFWFTHSIKELYEHLYHQKEKMSFPVKLKNKYEKIAVIAMDGIFPKATDCETLWKNITAGIDAIIKVPNTRFDIDSYYDPYPLSPGKTNSLYGGFINLGDSFLPSQFGLKPRSVEMMDPQQKILLMQTDRMLAPFSNYSFMKDKMNEKTGIYLGVGFPDYMIQSIKETAIEKINAYSGVGMADFSSVGRIAYHFGFQGPAIIIKTACSSSLVSVHQAARALQSGDCDIAIAGGINLVLVPEINVCLTKGGFLSPEGRCKAFDATANGYVRSEGSGLVLLKRYDDAVAAGDNILAVIVGSAINQDGTSNGLTAPSGQAQIACYEAALNSAEIAPSEVSYIEAHGTGTQLGDAIEMASIQHVYSKNRHEDNKLYVGAIKTAIGHCESAAGIAGLIKTIDVINHQVIPPNLHFKTLNSEITLDKTTQLPTKKIKFEKPCQYAAVSSFGVTGTNAHLILQRPISE